MKNLTVKQLIEKLKEFDEDAVICISYIDGEDVEYSSGNFL